jgi:hypothetical protein
MAKMHFGWLALRSGPAKRNIKSGLFGKGKKKPGRAGFQEFV